MVFASGSTGQPEGVVLAAGLLDGQGGPDRCAGLTKDDCVTRLLRWDTVGFIDLLACMRGGARLCVPRPETVAEPRVLWDWIATRGVSCLSAPVTVWRCLSRAVPASLPDRFRAGLLWGGTCAPMPLIARLESLLPTLRTDVSLGASECSYIGFGPVRSSDAGSFSGGPGGTRLADRDATPVGDNGRPVTEGQTGRLRLTAPSVAFGLFGDPISRNPVMDPQNWPASAIIENHVRRLPQGIDVPRRADDVVEIAGRRLTVGEVDSAVETLRSVTRSHSFVVEDDDGDTWLAVAVETDAASDAALPTG